MTPTNLIFTNEQIAALAESWKNKKKVALVFPRERLSSPAHCAARGSRVPPHSRPLLASACRTTYSDIPAGPRALPRPALGVLNLNRELTRSGMMPCCRAGHRRAVECRQAASRRLPPAAGAAVTPGERGFSNLLLPPHVLEERNTEPRVSCSARERTTGRTSSQTTSSPGLRLPCPADRSPKPRAK